MGQTEDKSKVNNKIEDSTINGKFVGRDDNSTNIVVVVNSSEKPTDEKISDGFEKSVLNGKPEYVDKWKAKLFLHRKAEPGITLENAYIPPEYRLGEIDEYRYDDLKEHLRSFIEGEQRIMLILGAPGIGKSSTVAYLANEYKDNSDVLVIKFRSLVEEADGESLLKYIKNELKAFGVSLKNKVLILDGFDEISFDGDKQELLRELRLDARNESTLKLIITSRESYVDLKLNKITNTITLLPFSPEKIRTFYNKIKGENCPDNINIENVDVLGIPVILYMALTVGIDLSGNDSKPELYEKIFALENGIFDRFDMEGINAYNNEVHPIAYVKEKFLNILRNVAYLMYEKDKLHISSEEYIEIAKKQGLSTDDELIMDFPIKNLYEEGSGIEFVHKSIYEYFVADYILYTINNSIRKRDNEKLAETFVTLFHSKEFNNEIIEYLINKAKSDISETSKKRIFETFKLMLQKGMTYYSQEKFERVIYSEAYIFHNMMDMIHLNHDDESTIDFEDAKKEIYLYLYTCVCVGANINLKGLNLNAAYLAEISLRGANLRGADFSSANFREASLINANLINADLSGANLRGVNLRDAYLSGADLSGADLSRADLSYAYLSGADLSYADLRDANLRDANLRDADLSYANLSRADLSGADLSYVYLSGADLSYVYLRYANLIRADLSGATFDTNNISSLEKINHKDLQWVYVEINEEDENEIIRYPEYKQLRDSGKL